MNPPVMTTDKLRLAIERVASAFATALGELGLDVSALPARDDYTITTDQQSGEITVHWSGGDGKSHHAYAVFKASGAIFGELEVHQPHPQRHDRFIEQIELWGDDEQLIHEASLLPHVTGH